MINLHMEIPHHKVMLHAESWSLQLILSLVCNISCIWVSYTGASNLENR